MIKLMIASDIHGSAYYCKKMLEAFIKTLEEELDVRYSIGKKEGREDEKKDTARKMKADGLDDEIISKYTGLSIEEIEKL